MKLFFGLFLISTAIFAKTNTVGCSYRVSDSYNLNPINNGSEFIVLSKTINTPSWGVYYNMISFYDNVDIAKSKNMFKEASSNDEFIATSFVINEKTISVKDASNNTVVLPITSTTKDNSGKIITIKGILNSINSLVFNGNKFGEGKIIKYFNDNFDGKLDPLSDYQEGVTAECDFSNTPKCALSIAKAYSSKVTF